MQQMGSRLLFQIVDIWYYLKYRNKTLLFNHDRSAYTLDKETGKDELNDILHEGQLMQQVNKHQAMKYKLKLMSLLSSSKRGTIYYFCPHLLVFWDGGAN